MEPNVPSNETLRGFERCLAYYPVSGKLVWKERWSNRSAHTKVGEEAGSENCTGYRVLDVHWNDERQAFKVHRIAWFLFHGEWPQGVIDHVNRDPLDNRIVNLREATRSENSRNAKLRSDNKTGHRAVWAAGDRFRAVVYLPGGGRKHLGYYDTAEEASAAVEGARAAIDGEFYHNPNGRP